MKKVILLFALIITLPLAAQKKLLPASKSAYTGIGLPAGSLEDKRLLSTAAAALFLEDEGKKVNVKIKTAEVFQLPAKSNSGYGVDELKESLQKAGWNIMPIKESAEYGWLQKADRYFIFYFSVSAAASDLYFGEPDSTPVFADVKAPESTPVIVVNNDKQVTEQPVKQNKETDQTVLNPTEAKVNTVQSANHGITISTTNFDDGWVSQPFEDYVRVIKGSITVLLHYSVKITDEMRAQNDLQGYLFDMFMQPRYVVSNIRKYDNGGPCYFCIYFYEADVIDKATNKKYYAGLRVLIENGIARCIEILSPSEQEFQKEFPTQEKIAAMTGYNKFAVCQADLIGEWDESSGAYVNMYSTVTGAYAGMNSSSSANKFTFKPDGTYFSNHKGAFGMVGSMQFYDQKYNGNYTVTNWDVTATK
jgi:hypothetical protein